MKLISNRTVKRSRSLQSLKKMVTIIQSMRSALKLWRFLDKYPPNQRRPSKNRNTTKVRRRLQSFFFAGQRTPVNLTSPINLLNVRRVSKFGMRCLTAEGLRALWFGTNSSVLTVNLICLCWIAKEWMMMNRGQRLTWNSLLYLCCSPLNWFSTQWV